jgi:hypothetical protein
VAPLDGRASEIDQPASGIRMYAYTQRLSHPVSSGPTEAGAAAAAAAAPAARRHAVMRAAEQHELVTAGLSWDRVAIGTLWQGRSFSSAPASSFAQICGLFTDAVSSSRYADDRLEKQC